VSVAVLAAADVFTAYMPVLGQQRGISPDIVGVILGLVRPRPSRRGSASPPSSASSAARG
jgi:hypothetical protein